MLMVPSAFITGAGSGALPVGLPSLPRGLDSLQRGSCAHVAIGVVVHGPNSELEVETQVAPKKLVPGRQWLSLPVHPKEQLIPVCTTFDV